MDRIAAAAGGTLLAVLLAFAPAEGSAQDSHNADTVGRITRFRELGTANKNIVDELNASEPHWEKVRGAAGELVTIGRGMPDWFPPGTGREEDSRGWMARLSALFTAEAASPVDLYRTRARPEIWQKPDVFRQLYEDYGQAAERVSAAAAAGDITALRGATETMGKACQACHEAFRHPER